MSILAAVAVLLAGCAGTTDSTSDFKGESQDVAQVIEDYQDAARKGDDDKVCNRLLATALVKKIEADGQDRCQDRMKDALRDVDAFELDVKKVAVTGTSATATVKSPGGSDPHEQQVTLVKEGTPATWKISEIGR